MSSGWGRAGRLFWGGLGGREQPWEPPPTSWPVWKGEPFFGGGRAVKWGAAGLWCVFFNLSAPPVWGVRKLVFLAVLCA